MYLVEALSALGRRRLGIDQFFVQRRGNWDVLVPRVHGNHRISSFSVRRHEPDTCTTQDEMKHIFEATTFSRQELKEKSRNCSMDLQHEPSVRNVVAGRLNISGPDVRASTPRFLPRVAMADWS